VISRASLVAPLWVAVVEYHLDSSDVDRLLFGVPLQVGFGVLDGMNAANAHVE
jgi:hypothetical protein